MPRMVIVGSLNMDLVVQVPIIPAPGETVLGNNFATIPGGKGPIKRSPPLGSALTYH